MASSPKAEIEAEVADPLKAEVAALRADLADLGKMVARIGKQRAAGLKSAASTTAADGYARGEAALDVVLAELQSLEDEVAEAARRRPFASLGLAALFGFLVGVLFRR
jgi:ElaB/YqjD/DUF883 family membrane-anchored ribosome-binding protein